MSDLEAMLATVIAYPKDDLPRLVLADYLEENGDPVHAELIRVMCELATLKRHAPHPHADGCPVCSARNPLEARQYELLQYELPRENMANWLLFRGMAEHPAFGKNILEVRSGVGPEEHQMRCDLDRGFVRSVVCGGHCWLRHGPELAKWHPVEECVVTTPLPLEFVDHVETDRKLPGPHGDWLIESRWTVRRTDAHPTDHRDSERFAMPYTVSGMRLARNGEAFFEDARSEFRRRSERARTPLGYLGGKWKTIRFVYAPEQGGGLGLVRRAYESYHMAEQFRQLAMSFVETYQPGFARESFD